MRIKVAIVGAGSMGWNHIRVLRDWDEQELDLTGIAEVAPAALAKATNRFNVPGYADYRTLIEQTHPDLVVVVVPTHMHREVASFALESGAHVLVEKPITSTIEDAQALIDLARASGKLLAVGHVERFNPAVRALKQQLDDGNVGTIFSLLARRLGPFPPRVRDVGVTLDLAVHDIDVMRYLTGSEVVHVHAEVQRRVHEAHEDLILGMLRFRNRAIGVLDVNWLTPTKVRELSVTGERGLYLVNYLTQDLYYYENEIAQGEAWDPLRTLAGVSEGNMIRLKVQKVEPLRLQYEDIISAIRTGSAVTVPGEDGLAALRVAQQLVTAAPLEVRVNV